MGRDAALGELARRYLAGHAPASDRDLARWAGIGLRDARLGLARCGAVQRADGLAELPGTPQRGAALPPPLLLGAFDPLLLGWASRDPIVGPHRLIVTINGLFRPFALADGRAVATWTITRGQVMLAPFAPLGAQTRAALDTDAADVTRFLGGQDGRYARELELHAINQVAGSIVIFPSPVRPTGPSSSTPMSRIAIGPLPGLYRVTCAVTAVATAFSRDHHVTAT
jgi:hypothetical protein